MNKLLKHFIIAGAPRCGTTWLVELLEPHSQIFLAKPIVPEPKFFLVDSLYEKGFSYYVNSWFQNAPAGVVTGEKSTNYLENAHVAARIHKHIPDVKLIFLLRDPVERAFNNYLWSKMNGLETEDFETAISIEKLRKKSLPENLRYARPFDYFSRGLYAKHLEAYFDKFPSNNILCLRLEDIATQPVSEAVRVHSFLEVRVQPEDAIGLGVINKAEGEDSQTIPQDMRDTLSQAYAGPNSELERLLGPGFKAW